MLRYGRTPLLIHHVLHAFAAKYITCSCFRVDGMHRNVLLQTMPETPLIWSRADALRVWTLYHANNILLFVPIFT